MSLKLRTLIVASILCMGSIGAGATTVTITSISGGTLVGTNEINLTNNAQVTVGLRFTSDSDNVYGLGVSAHDYDESLVDFVSGTAVSSIFHAFCQVGVGCFGGVSNFHGGALSESSIGSEGNRVVCLDFPSTSATNSNPLDPGIDGVIGGGDNQAVIVFEADASNTGTATITFGTDYQGDAVVLSGGTLNSANAAVLTIHVVP